MANPALPFEIVFAILSNLKDQRMDLQSCALVCDRWRAQSQAYLFHSVILTTAHQCQRLRELVIRSSSIVSSIKEITFDVDIGLPSNCIGALDAMATILRFLKLEVLSLSASSQDDKRDLPPMLCEAIAFSLGQPSISSFRLRGLSLNKIDFQNLFIHSRALRHLSLSNVSCRPSDDEHSEGVLVFRPGIEELVVELEDARILEWFGQAQSCVNLTCLRSLTIVYDMNEAQHELINVMLRRAGACLEDLCLRCVSGMSDSRIFPYKLT